MTTIAQILFSYHLEKFTGKVTLSKDQVRKTIFFRKGTPVYVDSSLRSETLGQMLLEQGRLTQDQYNKTLERMQETKKRQGECIVELGYMSGFDVYQALSTQAERKLQNAFLLDGARVDALEGEKCLEGISDIQLDLFKIYLDLYYSTFLLGDSPLQDQKGYRVSEKARTYLLAQSLGPLESKITRALDGTRSHAQILTDLASDSDEVDTYINALLALGWVEEVEAAPQKFRVPASQVAKEKTDPGIHVEGARKVVQIGDEKKSPDLPSNPIYLWALKIDRPYFELLGVTPLANKLQVKKSYDKIVADLKLDSIDDSYEEKERPLAESVLDRLAMALTVMSDDKRKHEYLKGLGTAKAQPAKQVAPEVLAEVALQKAQLHLQKKSFEKAELDIQKAIEFAPKESSYHVELAVLLLQKATHTKTDYPETIEKELKSALELNSADVSALFHLGTYYKLKNDLDRAKGCFSRVLETNKNHPKALAELRLLNKREEEKKKGESTILKLFKKK